jgi:type IV secretory pathway VirB3-like protein
MLFTVLTAAMLAGIVLLWVGMTTLGLAILIVSGVFLLLLGLVVLIGLIALASEHPDVRRKR